MNVPLWLVLIVVAWSAMLPDAAQLQPSAGRALLDLDSREAVVSSDRNASVRTADRRRAELAGDDNPPALGSTLIAPLALWIVELQPATDITRAPATRQPHSPSQPRAPPVDAVAHAG